MELGTSVPNERFADVRHFEEKLKRGLPPDSAVLADLLSEPDSMPAIMSSVLIVLLAMESSVLMP